jgi:hypothetical protein
MVDIVVVRGGGTRPGEDIVDPFITTVEVALSRGQAELDEGALSDESVLECVLYDARLGDLVEVDDSTLGWWRGKITGITQTVKTDEEGNVSGSTSINLRKPRS